MTLLAWQKRKIQESLTLGATIRAVAKTLGLSKNTVNKYRTQLEAAGIPVLCACGRPSKHKGLCAPRQQKVKDNRLRRKKEKRARAQAQRCTPRRTKLQARSQARSVPKPQPLQPPSAPQRALPPAPEADMIAAFIAQRGITRLPAVGTPELLDLVAKRTPK